MHGVISLGVGEPDFPTPWSVREAGIHALEHGATTYTSNSGLLELREAICEDLADRYGVRYRADDECLITAGCPKGWTSRCASLLNPATRCSSPNPATSPTSRALSFAGGTPVPVPTSRATPSGSTRRSSAPRSREDTKAILFGSPANPTGAVAGARPTWRPSQRSPASTTST